jgi:membrane protein
MSARHPGGVSHPASGAWHDPPVKVSASSRVQQFRPVRALVDLITDWIARFVAVQGVDRAMAIAAMAYTALFPLLIVYVSVSPLESGRSFSELLINRLELDKAAADSVRQAFAPVDTVQSGITALSVCLLLFSGLSFTRGLQRLYEGAFSLPTRGMRNTKWGLVWLLAVTSLLTVRPLVLGGMSGRLETIASLTLSGLLWLITPYFLLGRRLRWLRLLPVAVLSVIGMTGVGIWSVLWMPHTIASSADQFGVIGIGFALLTWMVAIAGVLVVAATGGAMISDRLSRRRQPQAEPETATVIR